MRATHRFVSLALALIVPCIAFGAKDAITDARQHADELFAADRAFAAASATISAIDGMTAAFAEDVIVPVPGKGLVAGKAAVIEVLKANPDIAGAHIDWSPLRVGISADGTHGFTFGYMNQRKPDGTILPYKYLAYWVRSDGAWKTLAWKRSRSADGETEKTTMPPVLPGSGFAKAPIAPIAAAARDLERIEQAFSDEAQKIGLAPAFARYGTSESMILGGSDLAGFVFGADAIAAVVGEGQPATGSSVKWNAQRVIVAGSGDLGVSIGLIRPNAPASEAAENPSFPFFTVWRRASVDQPWRYIAE